MSRWKTKKMKQLARALLSIKTEQHMLNFLRDLATLEELRELSARWEVAQLIDQGVPYREISKQTGVSTATITRIAHWLHHGMGGYKSTLNKGK